MATVQWRPEVNALTTPQSYRAVHVPRNVIGIADLAARIAQKHPEWNEKMVQMMISSLMEEIQFALINGDQVTIANAFTFRLSFAARLDTPDDPLPPAEEVLRVSVTASRPFAETIQKLVQLERLPMIEKLPLVNSAEDTVLKLHDVLSGQGLLRLRGSDLAFNPAQAGCGCLIAGTRSGSTAQTRFGLISNSEITVLPDIPAQDDLWNNEYTLSVSTKYTENGTLRTGIYRRRLRVPLTMTQGEEAGILTDHSSSPHVTVTDAELSGAAETVRVQAVLDLRDSVLLLNLIDLKEGGRQGETVRVAADGPFVLQGFAGSTLASLSLTVNSFAQLTQMIRSKYSGRLVDVLTVRAGS
ncbi:HU family DNA-binding protein [Candidatus Electronema sp. TJ]|uniref:HU family DNA-binding protein n=1 Tax=Candidatus Electronema sp. TJ TaxID=3401573 RepID=UPI003AA913DD